MEQVDILAILGDWSKGKGPLYQRLATSLRVAIRKGDIAAPSRLPSERTFSQSLRVSRTTVVAAYDLLRDEGLLESIRGSGTHVVAPRGWLELADVHSRVPSLRFLDEPPAGVVDCAGSVIPDFGGFADESIQVTASDVRALASGYTYEPMGLPPLRAVIAENYVQLGMPCNSDDVLVTTGAQQAIELLFSLFGRNGGTILVEDPTYVGALDAAQVAGARIVGLPVDHEGVKVSALREALVHSRVNLVYLMTGCHNPTGAVMSGARRREVARLCEEAEVPVADDMTLADLVLHEGPPTLLTSSNGGSVITIGSLSKVFSPGLRVGWIRAPAQLIGRLGRLKMVADLGSAHLTQLVATRVIPRLDEIRTTRRQQFTQRLDLFSSFLQEQLPMWSFSRPQGGPFLWVKLPRGHADVFANLALRCGVRVLPGGRMSSTGGFADHLRISFVARPGELRTAVERLRRAWDSFSSSGAVDQVPMDVVV